MAVLCGSQCALFVVPLLLRLESSTCRVCTLELGTNVLNKCSERSDNWALEVKGWLEGCIDLVAEKAIYHKLCHVHFMSGLPAGETSSGRPSHTSAIKCFDEMCYNLETSCESNLYTLHDLLAKMKQMTEGTDSDLYIIKHIKKTRWRNDTETVFSSLRSMDARTLFVSKICATILLATSGRHTQQRKTVA